MVVASMEYLDEAAAPVGGGGAWSGFKTTRRAKLAARTASGRAAAHGAARPSKAHKAARPSRQPGTPKGRVPKYPPLVGSLSHCLVEAQAE